MDDSGVVTTLSRSLSSREIRQASQTYLLQNYARAETVLERGNGMYVFDADGERYLDFVGGIAVNALGHGDYSVVETIREHAGELIHVSNLYHTAPGAFLAQQLVENSFADRVFFCNSGTEAIEASIKFARRWARQSGNSDKYEIVSTERSFHGRTVGSISVTGQEQYRTPFEPLMPGVKFGRYNDIESTVSLITDNTAAVVLEPIQAEGGVHPATTDYLEAVREACNRHNALLILDEIQVGMGRTGKLWAHQHYGIAPDIMTLAKPLASGLPIGAVLLTQNVADAIKPGDHASTFGGGPLVCAVGLAVFSKINSEEFLNAVRQNGKSMGRRLRQMAEHHPVIQDVRGCGLIWGVQVDMPAAELVSALRARKVLACVAGPNVLRFLPPLIVTEDQIHQVLDHLDAILTDIETKRENAS